MTIRGDGGPAVEVGAVGEAFQRAPDGSGVRVDWEALDFVVAADVMIGEDLSEVLYAGGVPGTSDTYQVNFRVPEGAKAGGLPLRMVVAYVPGPGVTLPVR